MMRKDFSGFRPMRHDRLIQEARHDTYQLKGKLPEPTVCPECHAVYHKGHWQWLPVPEHAHSHKCPACLRMHDGFPAGYVELSGIFFQQHREEVLQQVRHHALQAKAEHPLERLINIEETNDSAMITTTDIHLARGIGEALHSAYDGELKFQYNDQENLLRVTWTR